MLLKNNYLHFILIAFLSFLFAYEYNSFIQTDTLISQSLSEKYTQEIINNSLNIRQTWLWVGYIFAPVILYLTTIFIAFVVLIVIWIYYMNETNFDVKFSNVWRIVLFAQWSTLAAAFIKIFWFGVICSDYTLEYLSSFYPLSIINFFDINTLDKLFIYPISLINLFELAYWIILVVGVKKLLNQTYLKSFEIVFLSYGILLIIWIVAMMFISINLTN
ncbi:MAG: hypothetical protein LBN95_06870 [Prevotellaceae bacterium]|jgi:hypothetical protein|nr:hypothetical protein [Prevotellaceae bacterium]